MQTPNDIWSTPRMTDSFIFIEFRNPSSLIDMYHAGSTPIGYTQSGA